MHIYETLSQAIQKLRERGYTTDFNITFDQIKCAETGICFVPAQFEIVEHHRFEGNSDPADESVVYAIESVDGKMKGVLVSAYGAYSESINEEMIKKLSMNE